MWYLSCTPLFSISVRGFRRACKKERSAEWNAPFELGMEECYYMRQHESSEEDVRDRARQSVFEYATDSHHVTFNLQLL